MSKKHREAVRKQFAKTVEAFSKHAVRDTPEVLAEKVEFAKPQPTDFALDVACGSGAFVLALAPRVHFARGIGFGLLYTAESSPTVIRIDIAWGYWEGITRWYPYIWVSRKW